MPEWVWEYDGYDPSQEAVRESLCTLGNGYFATRGAAPESRASLVHYPATYAAGCYDRLESALAGRRVQNEDLVNLPNWLRLRFRARSRGGATGPWFSPDDCELLAYRQSLDLRRGLLLRSITYRDPVAGVLDVEQCRLVHMADPHLAALRTEISAREWSGSIEVESGLDAEVINGNVHRYRRLERRHLCRFRTGSAPPDTSWLACRTRGSDIGVGMAVRTLPEGARPASSWMAPSRRRVLQRLVLPLTPDAPVTTVKTAALHTSRDRAIDDPLQAAIDRVTTAPGFPALLATHAASWERLWRRSELEVPGEPGRILRLHLFHVLQTLSPHTQELDVGVPARGLHGEAYRGHVFWDELFVLPYLNLHFPEVSRALLDYRYRRLPRACRSAAEAGRSGAMYPWQSGSDGREETPELHLNPRSGRWLPDHSHLQHHVGSAVAYNVWQYCQTTGDTEYLHTRGAEMLLQIARFWADSAELDPRSDHYHLRGVVGPDEFHDAYPGVSAPGLDDNAYTNVTASWVLARAIDLVRGLPSWRRGELLEQIGMEADALQRWQDVSRRLWVPFHEGVISQFAGYEALAELDWSAYRERYGDIRRLDRILEAEGDSVNRYQASKQADVLMLGYLFPFKELAVLLDRLGHRLTEEAWRRTVEYYLSRTCHGSTLSGLVHGWVLARSSRGDAWRYVQEALEGDVADVQGGTTGEGIHLGAMAGTLDLVQRGLTGLRTVGGVLRFDPAPLPELSEYRFALRLRGHWGVAVRMRGEQIRITVPPSGEGPVRVALPGRTATVTPGTTRTVALRPDSQGPDSAGLPDPSPPGRGV